MARDQRITSALEQHSFYYKTKIPAKITLENQAKKNTRALLAGVLIPVLIHATCWLGYTELYEALTSLRIDSIHVTNILHTYHIHVLGGRNAFGQRYVPRIAGSDEILLAYYVRPR